MSANDPQHALTFDLARGRVLVGNTDHVPVMLVPVKELVLLAQAAGPSASTALATSLGQIILTRLSKGAFTQLASGESFVTQTIDSAAAQIGTELALLGLGTLSLERWGRALVLCAEDGVATQGSTGELLFAAIASFVLSGVSGKDVRVTSLAVGRSASSTQGVRFLVSSSATAERVSGWLREGVSWGDAITRLHTPTEAAQ